MELHPIVEKFINKRNIDKDLFKDLTKSKLPSPHLIPNIDKLEQVLEDIKTWGSKVVIVSDYDFDGTSSAAILYETFKELEINVEVIVTNRKRDGYGLSNKVIDIVDEREFDLIITTDCGITQDEEIEYARLLGIDVFVLDHHNRRVKADFNYIDLKVNQGFFETDKLSSGGLAYFISKYLIGDKADKYLDLAGFSTVADLVDLDDKVNRILALEGVRNIQNKGLLALIQIKGLDPDNIIETDIGFSLAPCINAVGRLGDNYKSFELFTTKDKNKRFKLAKEINDVNERRKNLTEKTVEIVEKNVDLDNNIIIYKDNINKGLTGLVAGKLQNKYNKPAIVMNTKGKGSGRSLEPLDLQKMLQNHLDIVEYANGHSKAFGIHVKKENYERFQQRMYNATKGMKYESVDYDIEVHPDNISSRVLDDLDKLRPFGMNIPQPKFIHDKEDIVGMKQLSGGKHLKFYWYGVDAIWFNTTLTEFKKYDRLIYTPGYNTFMGNTSIQLIIQGGYYADSN